MKDIKTLYQNAKRSHDKAAISEYNEAVQSLLESKPVDFLSNLKYIISSSTGLPMLEKFEEKYGISIAAYEPIMECLDDCIARCEEKKIDASAYKESKAHYEDFRKQYQTCFNMFEYYASDDMKDGAYLETYYGFNSNGIQNNKLIVGMIDKFGESAIADSLITANGIGTNAVAQVLSYVECIDRDKFTDQWLCEASSEINIKDKESIIAMTEFSSNSISHYVDQLLESKQSYIREGLLTGDPNPIMVLTEEDTEAIVDLIKFKEYQLTCLEDASSIDILQKEIYSLYEEIDHICDADGNSGMDVITEAKEPTPAKMVTKRILDLCKEITKITKPELKKRTKAYNKDNNYRTREDEHVFTPSVFLMAGDDMDPFKYKKFGLSKKVDELILRDKTSSEWLDKVKLYMILQVTTGSPLSNRRKRLSSNFYNKELPNILKPLIDSGKIKFEYAESKEINLTKDQQKMLGDSEYFKEYYSYTYYITTWTIPILINRSFLLGGINLNEAYALNEDIADSVVPMLPSATNTGTISKPGMITKPIEEDLSWANTRNKKVGTAPGYLATNHDLSYGEDEPSSPHKNNDNDDVSLEDLKRKSASASNDNTDEHDSELDNDPSVAANPTTPEERKLIQNYYYTYNGSLNKYSHSYNQNDDHSVDNSVDNTKKTDDHSTGKHIGSHNDNTDDHSNDKGDNRDNSTPQTEGFLDVFRKKKHKHIPETVPPTPSEPIVIDKSKIVVISPEIKTQLVEKITDLKNGLNAILAPFIAKYPIFNFSIQMDINDSSDLNQEVGPSLEEKLLFNSKWLSNLLKVSIDKPTIYLNDSDTASFDISIYGCGWRDLWSEIINTDKYPDEKIKWKADIELNDKIRLSEIFWAYPMFGYDKAVQDICEEISNIIKEKYPIITNWGYNGDGDGIFYGGRTSLISLYPELANMGGNDTSFFQQAPQQMNNGAIHTEAVGDADDNKPESDHPIKDTLMDIDKKSAEVNQKIKKGVQSVGNVGRAAAKPVVRTKQWVTNMINDWKDADENKVKEKMADPKARKNIFSAVAWCIKVGAILKAGLLLNPIFLFLTVTKKVSKDKNEYRIRNEMIGELKTELEVIDEKIEDARRKGDDKAKYQLMRLRNELNKKLLRVSGSEGNKKWLKGGIV